MPGPIVLGDMDSSRLHLIAFGARPLLAFGSPWSGEGMSGKRSQIELLVVASQGGDRRSLGLLVRALQGPMLRLANRVLRDSAAAEDAFVEAMSRVLPRIGDFPEPRAFLAYVRRSVRNASIDLRRTRSHRDSQRALKDTRRLEGRSEIRTDPLTERLPHPGPNPEVDAVQNERARRVNEAVEALKEPGRTIVRNFYVDGLSYDEIAERLSISRTTVKRQLSAARSTLAARLGGGPDDDR